jgi:hypothetical protein
VDRPAYGLPATVLVAVPLHGDQKALQRELSKLLDEATNTLGEDIPITPFQFERNKIRSLTLTTAMRVLRARAALPDKRLFVVGNRAKVSLSNVTEEKATRKDRSIADARRSMEILTSRWLHRGYLLAENAARGRFPSLEPLGGRSHSPGVRLS